MTSLHFFVSPSILRAVLVRADAKAEREEDDFNQKLDLNRILEDAISAPVPLPETENKEAAYGNG